MGLRNASNLLASSQLSGGGGGREVLWEWNGVDVSQFGNGVGGPTSTKGSPTGTLSVGTLTSPGGDMVQDTVLIYTAGGTNTTVSYFEINDMPALPERYTVRCRISDRAGSTYAAPAISAFGQDHLHWGGAFVLTGNLLTGVFADNVDAFFVSNQLTGTLATVDPCGHFIEIDVTAREPDTGVDPEVVLRWKTADRGDERAMNGAWTAWDSSWQSGGSVRNVGLLCDDRTVSTEIWWSELQVLSMPSDTWGY